MRRSVPIEIAALGATAAALLTLYFSCVEPKPTLDRSLHVALGQALAREGVALLPSGGRIAIITRDTEAFRQPALDVLLNALQSELRHAGVPAPALHLLQTDPLRPVDVPSGDFFELMRRPDVNSVVISLLGPPLLTSEQRGKLGKSFAKVVAFCPGNLAENVDLRQLFQAALLHAAVVPRKDSTQGQGKSTAATTRFDQLYQIVRPQDLSARLSSDEEWGKP